MAPKGVDGGLGGAMGIGTGIVAQISKPDATTEPSEDQ